MQLYNKSTKVTKYTANSWLTGGVGGKSGSGWSVGRVRACVRALRGSAVDSEQW